MYDTINMNIPFSEESLHFSQEYLENQRQIIDQDGIVIATLAKIKNLDVSINSNRIKIRGSLPRYLYGNNLRMPTLEEVRIALHSITKTFNVNPEIVKVIELHSAINLLTQKSCRIILDFLGNFRRKQKANFPNGIGYLTERNYLLVYDKEKKMKKEKMLSPELKNEFGKNILRIERRWKKLGMNNSLLGKQIYLTHLMEETFFKSIFSETITSFLNIEKKSIFGNAKY